MGFFGCFAALLKFSTDTRIPAFDASRVSDDGLT